MKNIKLQLLECALLLSIASSLVASAPTPTIMHTVDQRRYFRGPDGGDGRLLASLGSNIPRITTEDSIAHVTAMAQAKANINALQAQREQASTAFRNATTLEDKIAWAEQRFTLTQAAHAALHEYNTHARALGLADNTIPYAGTIETEEGALERVHQNLRDLFGQYNAEQTRLQNELTTFYRPVVGQTSIITSHTNALEVAQQRQSLLHSMFALATMKNRYAMPTDIINIPALEEAIRQAQADTESIRTALFKTTVYGTPRSS